METSSYLVLAAALCGGRSGDDERPGIRAAGRQRDLRRTATGITTMAL